MAEYNLSRALERSRNLSRIAMMFQAGSLIVWLVMKLPDALNELRLRLAIGHGLGALKRVALNMSIECSLVVLFSLMIALALMQRSIDVTQFLVPVLVDSLLISGLVIFSQCVLLAACAKRFQ